MSENIQNIVKVKNLIMKAIKNWKLELITRGQSPAEGEILLSGRFIVAVVICYSNDAKH